MIDWLREWTRNLSVFIIFAVFLEVLLPNNNFKKYIKLVIGFILILLMITPVTNLFLKNKTPFSFQIFNNGIEIDKKTLQTQQKYLGDYQKSIVLKEYKEKLKQQAEMLITKNVKVELKNIEVCVKEDAENFGALESITVTVGNSEKNNQTQTKEIIVINPISKINTNNIEVQNIGKSENTVVQKSTVDIEIENKIKNCLENFYNLKKDNIYVISI